MSSADILGSCGEGRAERGRFSAGNQYARGNPNNRRMAELRRTLLDAVDPKKLTEAFNRLQDQAARGDLQALQVYLNYVVGRPTQAVEVSGPEGSPLGGDLIGLVMSALSRHPEARIAVAAELRLARDGRVEPETEPFPGLLEGSSE